MTTSEIKFEDLKFNDNPSTILAKFRVSGRLHKIEITDIVRKTRTGRTSTVTYHYICPKGTNAAGTKRKLLMSFDENGHTGYQSDVQFVPTTFS